MYRGKNIAVVVPAYNEGNRVGRVLATIPDIVDRVIVVDDASTDDTYSRLREVEGGRLEIIRRDVNGGVGAAIVSGYKAALGSEADLVCVMAGDGQMDPADLPALLDPLVDGHADYAKGDRLSHDQVFHTMPAIRLIGNALLTIATRTATGLEIIDSQCGYTAITREALGRLPLDRLYPRYGFPNDLLMKGAAAGLRIIDVPVRPLYNKNPGASGIVLRSFIPRVGWLLLAGGARRVFRRGEWARSGAGGEVGRRADRRGGGPAAGGPRILVLSSSYPRAPGDHAGHFVGALARRWAARSEVTVLAPWDGRAPLEERCDSPRLKVLRFRYAPVPSWHRVAYGAGLEANLESASARFWFGPFLISFAVRALLEARRADVVVTNWLAPCGVIGALCRVLLGKPHMVIEHGGGLSGLKAIRPRGLGERLLAGVLRRTDSVFCVSEALRDDLLATATAGGLRLSARDVSVVPMGIESEHFSSTGVSGERHVLYIGRLIPLKGVEVLIEAMARLPGVMLSIAGDGPLEAALRAAASPLGGRVKFLGTIHGRDKVEALSRASVLVVPSRVLPGGRTEGLPSVILEGMAAGCPVVASDVGGIAELVRDGWNGMLVKPGDAQTLAERIGLLLDRPDIREVMAERARETARSHDADIVARRLALDIDRITQPPLT